MRQRRWLELLKDYDCTISYHPRKDNVVGDALSRSACSVASLKIEEKRLRERLCNLEVNIKEREDGVFLATTQVRREIIQLIQAEQAKKLRLQVLNEVHRRAYNMHPGITKMYRDLQRKFWSHVIKQHIAHYVGRCMTCQQVKAEYMRPRGLLEPLPILE